MAQEVIEVVEREVEVIEIIERGPQGNVGATGPTGPQANINYLVVSSSQTVSNRQMIAADTSGGSFTLTLPSNPAAGDAIDIFDYSDTFDTNPLTIARNGQNIEGLADDLVANVEGAYFTLIFTGGSRGWQVVPRYGVSGLQNVLTTEGDLIYRGASAETRLGIGSAGQILKVNSGATAPEWGNEVMSSADKTKLDGIAAGAEVNVNADWNAVSGDAQILNKPVTFTPSSHTHGNITNDGKIGATSGLPLVTTTAGAVTTLALGTANQVLRVNSGATGVEFGAGFDAASPPPIGSTTPSSGAFTTLTANNGTLSASAPVLNLSQTWNNAAVTFTGLRLNVTNTASAAASLLVDFQVGGTSRMFIRDDGAIRWNVSGPIIRPFSTTVLEFGSGGVSNSVLMSDGWAMNSTTYFGFSDSANAGSTRDVRLFRDAAAVLALRNLANPQEFRIYNTTDAGLTNHERGFMRWSSNEFQIGTEALGSGSNRQIGFYTSGAQRWLIGSGSGSLIGASSTANLQLHASALFQFGGTSSSFPALKRSSTTLQVRLADDSDFAPFTAAAITATGNLILTDNTGSETATFDAQSKLTANRTYDLPDQSGTIALLSNFLGAVKDMFILAPSADVTVASNTTLTGVSGMSFTAAASTTYLFVCYWQVDAGAGGYRMALNVPSNFQGAASQNGYGINITGANVASGISTIGLDETNILAVSRATSQTGPAFSIFAFRTTATGGTAEFRYSQASSNAANSTLKAESRVLVIPITS